MEIAQLCVVLLVAQLTPSAVSASVPDPLSDEFIDHINSVQSMWKAGRNFRKDTPMEYIKGLMGVPVDYIRSGIKANHKLRFHLTGDIPGHFDSREQWPNCPTLREIRDQGGCGSCWAFGAVTAMTDRHCIHSPKNEVFRYSAEEMVSCCDYCGEGCNGGDPYEAWEYWVVNGTVSGGAYDSNEGCQPYTIKPCKHRGGTSPLPTCIDHKEPTPKCESHCRPHYNVSFDEDRRYGKDAYAIFSEMEHIQRELMKNGPVEAAFVVYEDFAVYKSGVYKHVTGKMLGGHAVRLLGWGVENDVPYWLVANSWNTDWGDNGYFKILRGTDECYFEEIVVAGMPKFS